MNRADKHELEKNELADKLEAGASVIQPMLPVILGAIALLVVGSIGYGLYASSSEGKEAAAWTEYYFNLSGSDAESFLEVADGFPDSSMAAWARLSAGDNYLHQGVEAMYRNRKEGIENINSAISTYEEALNTDSEELRAKVLLGLGRAHETLGQLDQASDYYQQYASSSAPPQMIASVNERLSFLASPSGKKFYDWFTKLDPKPDSAIELPDNLSFPPTSPDLEFGSDNAGTSGGGASEPIGTAEPIDPSSVPELNVTAPEPKEGDINDLKLPEQEAEAGQGDSSGESSTDKKAEDDS